MAESRLPLPSSRVVRVPAPTSHLNELSATDVVRGIAGGTFTCEQVVRACIARIASQDEFVRAWTNFDAEAALSQAHSLDRETTRGPLHGLPIGVKDVIDTFDMPTEMGSQIYRGHYPPADAACVAQVRAAGAVILGKTVTCEFAGVTAGPTTNPHDETRTPGGSSSGSAAAVADCMVPIAFGTQTGGSVLRPASYCGVIGYKPTYNAFNRFGVKPAAEGLDTIGLIARTLDDVALVRAVLVGEKPAPLAAVPDARRVGLTRTHMWANAQPETVEAVEDAARRLNDAGAEIVEIALPDEFAGLGHAREIVNDYERAMGMAYEWQHHRGEISDRLRKIIERGLGVSHAEYVAAVRLAERCRAGLDAVFAKADALLAPCVRGEAPEGLHHTGDPAFQAIWTLLHTPTVTLPTAVGPNGLPVGIQLIGPRYEDVRLLAISQWIWDKLGIRRPWRRTGRKGDHGVR
jgi:Asp-tRNA(Asn)/Glu-tRNA(Gln) amidotransferase A subunit family amidase